MVEFKAVINDVKTGKSYQVAVAGHHANSLIGKKIGDVVDGIFVSLPGYKLTIAGAVIVEIDMVNMIYLVNGTDRLAEHRTAIGR